MIELTLARHEFTSNATLSAFYLGPKYLCNFLEDAVRKVKIYGKTAIPCGRYRVDLTWSGRFNCMLPLLVNVPLFTGIRMHSGKEETTVLDTEGCLLPGFDYQRNGADIKLYRSREAKEKLIMPIFQNANGEEVWITILGGYSASEMSKEVVA